MDMPNDPAPGPWFIDAKGHVYSRPLYAPAPFTDSEGNRHEDYMAGLVALVYGGPKTTALVAAASELLAALEAVDRDLEAAGTNYPLSEHTVLAIKAATIKARGEKP